MGRKKTNEKPEIYALRQDGGRWQISRRDFLKAAGIGTAAAGAGLHSRPVRPAYAEDLLTICKNAPAHKYSISSMLSSPDGRYLVTWDLKASRLKCWDFLTSSLISSRDDAVIAKSGRIMKTGSIGGRQYLFFNPDKEHIAFRELPLLEAETEQSFSIPLREKETLENFTIGKNGDIYAVLTTFVNSSNSDSGIVCFERGEGPEYYQTMREIYTQGTREITGIALVHGERELFILFKTKNSILLDLGSGETRPSNIKDIIGFTILPDSDTVFDASYRNYALSSLTDGSQVWYQKAENLKKGGLEQGGNLNVFVPKVIPDGSAGVLLGYQDKGNYQIWLVSLADGTYIDHLDLQVPQGNYADSISISYIDIAPDGSRLAVAIKGALLMISLPDLKIIGCPADVDEMTNDLEAMEISAEDPSSGETLTYTLPAGADIPSGAVCTCNVVAGRGGAPCECDTHLCRCVGFCNCDGHIIVDRHYWHPN